MKKIISVNSGTTINNEETDSNKKFIMGYEQLVDQLKYPVPSIQGRAALALANYSNEKVNQDLIIKAGGIEALVGVLKSCVVPETIRNAVTALGNLAKNTYNHIRIIEAGGIKALVDLLDFSEANEKAKWALEKFTAEEKQIAAIKYISEYPTSLPDYEYLLTILNSIGIVQIVTLSVNDGNDSSWILETKDIKKIICLLKGNPNYELSALREQVPGCSIPDEEEMDFNPLRPPKKIRLPLNP